MMNGRQAETPEGAAQFQLFKIVKIGFLQSWKAKKNMTLILRKAQKHALNVLQA